jgi:hypothetical protein
LLPVAGGACQHGGGPAIPNREGIDFHGNQIDCIRLHLGGMGRLVACGSVGKTITVGPEIKPGFDICKIKALNSGKSEALNKFLTIF